MILPFFFRTSGITRYAQPHPTLPGFHQQGIHGKEITDLREERIERGL